MENKFLATKFVRIFLILMGGVLLSAQTAFAVVSYSQTVALQPGWNIVSTPRILESHSFSMPETSTNLSVFMLDASDPSGWAPMSGEFVPLCGYFINNKTATSQTLTFNFKASTTPNERLFERKFTKEGWYSFGIANPSYAKSQGGGLADTDNPDHVLNSMLGAVANYDSVVDFTDADFGSNADSVALKDPWNLRIRSADVSNTTEINSLNDFRETKGYAIYVKATSTLNGFQNDDTPQCVDGVDNDSDTKIDYPDDLGCASALDTDETNLPSGTLALEKYASYANQTTSVPQTAYKIGEYKLIVGSTDTYTLTGFELDLSASTVNLESLTNIYIDYGGVIADAYATGTSALVWVGNAGTLLPDSVLSIKVYASIPSSAQNGEVIKTALTVSGISHNTGDTKIAGIITGQTIATGNGTLTTSMYASTPVSALVVANSMPKIASFKYTALHDSFTIKDMGVTVGDANAATAITELVFKDGATEYGRVGLSGFSATATALNITIPLNSSKVIDVYANLGAIGTGFADTGANVGVTLVSTKYTNSSGVEQYENTSRSGNAMYVHKTKPTIANVALPTTVLSVGTMAIAKINITADAGGTLAWRKIVWNVATSSPGTFTLGSPVIYDAANESMSLANVSTTIDSNTGVITVTSSVDQEVSGSKTYVLKATIGGSVQTGASVSTSIAGGVTSHSVPTTYAGVASNSSFVWSDESVAGHSDTTIDWMDDYLVKNLPTDSQTLTK